jgi:SAM-dependent methyltransferase
MAGEVVSPASANPQKSHYESLHDAYQEYYDPESMAYREQFIYGPLFDGVDLNGCDVADLACGSGATSKSILQRFPRARTFGFDISARACEDYARNLGRPSMEADLTRGVDAGRTFDFAVIIGGIHHCVIDLPGTLRTIRTLLKPGGMLLMMEPSDDFVFAHLRTLWYKVDHYFDAPSEHALSHDKLIALAGSDFSVAKLQYLGGPGYFLIFNSMVFRLPRIVKTTLNKPLVITDVVYNKLPGVWPFPYFVARWRRT